MNEHFWAVWRMNGGGAAQKRHASRDEAIAEAGRLAANTNDTYCVLESIGTVRPVSAPVEFVRNDGLTERVLIKPNPPGF